MIQAGAVIGNAWREALQLAIGAVRSMADLETLRADLSALAWRADCPSAVGVGGVRDVTQYRRHLVASGGADGYQALLISWPPGYHTPLHDHDGLWGIELVLDGALTVNEYRARQRDGATRLTSERSLLLGIGDAAAFCGVDYVHSCRNLSADRRALSLHVYGGVLAQYTTFAGDNAEGFRAVRQHARFD
jgi:hypothetical protein